VNSNGIPILITDGRKERKPKKIKHARDRNYFKFQKTNHHDTPFISQALKGRNSGITTVRLVRRITGPNGKFKGVVLALIRESQLLNFYDTTRTGPNSSATLVGLNKIIRLRKSHRGLDGIGKKIEKSKLWEHLKKSPGGQYRQASIVDGISRLWAYQKLDDFPLVAVIGTAIPDLLKTTNIFEWNAFEISLVISLLITALILFAFREIVASKRIAREVFEHQKTEQELEIRNELLQRLNKARKESESANRAKSDFLSSMSHELRTPLNAVLGYAQLLGLNPTEPLSDKQKIAVDSIAKGGQHLLDLINQVLELSQIEAGKLQLSIESLNPMLPIEDCLVIARAIAEPRSITVENIASKKVIPFIRADPTRFKQLMLNLLSNSIKYNKDAGSVTVDAEATANGMLRISISDTGAGIPQKDHAKVFEPFERFGMKSTEIEGTGIGLTISKQLVELMGGSTGFQSESGIGSTFWIELPIGEARDPSLASNNSTQVSKASGMSLKNDGHIARILYVEDNKMNVELMKSIFDGMLDAELMIATTGEDGIEQAMSEHPDLILMDIGLPGISGIEATNILKQTEETQDIPIVAITAATMKDEADRAKAVDFFAHLTKPINIAETLKVVQNALDKKSTS